MSGMRTPCQSRTVLHTIALWVALSSALVAQLSSRPAEEWVKVLDAPERVASLKVDDVVAALKLRPGDVVADLGAGSGPFIPAFARAVSAKGKVYAVEIDRGFFPFIEAKAAQAGVGNVQTVLGDPVDPMLPAADVDVAFFHDVLHHIDDRAGYLRNLGKYLKPGARVAIIDYHAAQSPHRDQPQLQVTPEQAAAWLSAASYKPIQEIRLFADKWYVIYGR